MESSLSTLTKGEVGGYVNCVSVWHAPWEAPVSSPGSQIHQSKLLSGPGQKQLESRTEGWLVWTCLRGARWASRKSLSKGIEAPEGCQAEGCMVTWWMHMADGTAERAEEVLGCRCVLCTAWLPFQWLMQGRLWTSSTG